MGRRRHTGTPLSQNTPPAFDGTERGRQLLQSLIFRQLAVFVGGGSILLKKQIEASGKVGAPIFVDEISANTKGYELLFKAACMG